MISKSSYFSLMLCFGCESPSLFLIIFSETRASATVDKLCDRNSYMLFSCLSALSDFKRKISEFGSIIRIDSVRMSFARSSFFVVPQSLAMPDVNFCHPVFSLDCLISS